MIRKLMCGLGWHEWRIWSPPYPTEFVDGQLGGWKRRRKCGSCRKHQARPFDMDEHKAKRKQP